MSIHRRYKCWKHKCGEDQEKNSFRIPPSIDNQHYLQGTVSVEAVADFHRQGDSAVWGSCGSHDLNRNLQKKRKQSFQIQTY